MVALGSHGSVDDPTLDAAVDPGVAILARRDESSDSDAEIDDDDPELLAAGAWVGRYQILEVVGTGGIGIVYAARDQDLGRNVALKLLRPHTHSARKLERRRARLVREAQALARLSHPNVVPIYEVGMFEDRVYLAMEYIEGSTMRRWIKRSHPSPAEILAKYREAGRGLAAAHAADIVHRDFKPENVLVGYDGRVRVLDFGLATPVPDALASGRYSTLPLDSSASKASASTSRARQPVIDPSASTRAGLLVADEDRKRRHDGLSARAKRGDALGSTTTGCQIVTDSVAALVTAHGKIMGTPAYMAPEQARGDVIDARADQYSFCVSLWEALLGERPEPRTGEATRSRATRRQRRVTERHHALSHDLPLSVLRALERGLSPEPRDRFASMDELLDALDTKPAPARRWLVAAGAGLVFVATLGFALAPGRSTAEQCPRDLDALERVWDEPMREAVKTRITDSGQAYASATWKTVEHELDRWVERWLDAGVDNCEDTRVRDEQRAPRYDQRRACLERQRVALATVTTSLAQGPGGAQSLDAQLDHVLASVLSLPDPEACEHDPNAAPPSFMIAPAPAEAPPSPAEAPRSPAHGEQLDELRALLSTGELDAGLARAETLIARLTPAEPRGPQARARAEALLLRALLLAAADHAEASHTELRAALFAGQSSGHDRVTVEASTALARQAAAAGELDRASDWLELARASLTRMGGDFALEQGLALALFDVADLARAEGRVDQAEALVREAKDRGRGRSPTSEAVEARAGAWLRIPG